MANDVTMTVKAVFLPDEIQQTLEDQTMAFNPGVGAYKWWYGMVNVISSSTDLIPTGAQPLGTSSASAKSADAGTAVDTVEMAATDEVRFLLIKNMGLTEDGTTASTDSVYLTLDDGAAAHSAGDAIEIGAGEIWYAKLNSQIGRLHSISGLAGKSGTSSDKVQCLVAAIIDTT